MTWYRRETPAAPGMAPSAGSRGPSRAVAAILAAAVAAAALVLAAGRPAAAAKPPEGVIDEIRIEGLVTIPEEKVRREIQSRVGRPWNRDVLEGDLRRLSKMQWFSAKGDGIRPFINKDPRGDGVILTFVVREMPVLRSVEFRGRTKVSLKDIETSTGLKAGARAEPVRVMQAVNQIKNLYDEKGYELAEVQLIEGDKPGDTRAVFEIFEGPWVKVGGVDFVGNVFATDAQLRTKVSSRPPILFIGGSYKPDEVESDRRKLIDYYVGQGYLEARVSYTVRAGSDIGEKRLTFVVAEGIQYKVRNIEFHGNEKLTAAQLKEGMLLHSGQPYNESIREVDQKKLQNRYSALGFVDVQIREDRKYVEHGVVDLTYDIAENEMYQVGEIIIHGNQRTRDKVIRRELLMAGIVPGQPLDGNRLEIAKKRLMSLGYFQANPEQGKPIELKIVNRRGKDQPYAQEDQASVEEIVRTARFQDAENDPAPPPAASPAPAPEAAPPAPGRDGIAPFGGAPGPFDPAPDQLPAINAAPLPAGPPGPAPAPGLPAAPRAGAPRGPIRTPIDSGVPPGTFPSFPGSNTTDVGPDRQEAFTERGPMNVNTQVEPGPNTNGSGRSFADIDAGVDEAPTGNLMVGVSASSFQGLNGNVIIHEKNFDLFAFPRSFRELFSGQAFRGAGQDLQIQFSPGTVINRAMISFKDPYLFNLPIGFNASGYAFSRLYPDFNERRVGVRTGLGRQFGTQTYADVALRVEDINFNGFKTPAPADFLAASGHSLLASLRPSIRFDNRNDPMAPNKGQYLEFSYEQGWGTFTYPKVEVTGKQYFTTGSRADGTGKRILTFRGTFGATGRDTPVYERYFAGDFGSMRGFAFRGVGPHVLGVNVGGVMRAIGSVEYQVPLIASDKLQQVVFCDFGSVESGYSFTGFRAAVGTGFRITIPQLGPMPLAFDLAIPLAKEPGDKTRYFTFFIGTFW